MARLIEATDRIAKSTLEDGRLSRTESTTVQSMGSYAEILMKVAAQAKVATDAWRGPGESVEMRKLIRMLRNLEASK